MHGNCRYLGRVEFQVALLPEGLEVLLLGILTQRFLTQVSSRLSVTFGDFKIHLCKHFHLSVMTEPAITEPAIAVSNTGGSRIAGLGRGFLTKSSPKPAFYTANHPSKCWFQRSSLSFWFMLALQGESSD